MAVQDGETNVLQADNAQSVRPREASARGGGDISWAARPAVLAGWAGSLLCRTAFASIASIHGVNIDNHIWAAGSVCL